MRLLYIDIDSLRLDHLGCYGYLRDTSPNIDQLAQESTRFTNVYVSDAPCLPSRTALWSGRTGFHNGVVNHGGTAAQPFPQGPNVPDNNNIFRRSGWMNALANLGMKTATISPFGQRHCAWHWYASFNEIYNPGKNGDERADEIVPLALDWLERNGNDENWFLHVNLWDPHTPFRTPASYGNPFEDQPLPDWFTEEMWQRAWDGFGPHSPQEPNWLWGEVSSRFPRQPDQIDSLDAVRQWVDSYDTGIRYADEWIGKIFAKLKAMDLYDETIIVVSADHGETIGELNVWGDHQTADHITCNVPLIIRYPGLTESPHVDTALHYHFDWAATIIELLGGTVPENWDGISFADAFREHTEKGREVLVTSQGAWSCQRGVRFQHAGAEYLCLRTYHDGFKELEPMMLFNLNTDFHLQHDLSQKHPDIVAHALALLENWYTAQMLTSETNIDPMMTVLREGGPFYTRGYLPRYIARLIATHRAPHAERLAHRHPDEV